MNLVAVPPGRAAEAWPLAEKYILDVEIKTGLVESTEVRKLVMGGEATMWLAADGTTVVGAGVTRLVKDRCGKVCEIFAWGADDQSKCAPLLKTIEKFARKEGCASVRLMGRRGWARLLSDYRLTAVVLEKELP